ncbi:MAG TPA: tetraacyldisaccharide 4'-kinase, partial [Candidatus Krumholzibacteria bacterium]
PLDGGHLLPAGRLREKPDALRRADVVVFNGADTRAALDAARDRVAHWLRADAIVAGMARRVTLVAADGSSSAAPRRLLAVSAIARPAAFEQSLAAAGIEVAGHVIRRDHHRYDAEDARAIDQLASREGLDVVTTEKDWVKLRGRGLSSRVWVARLEVSLHGDPLPV